MAKKKQPTSSAPEPWGKRINAVLERAGQSPLASVQKRPGDRSLGPYILPPAGERRVVLAEADLGITIPACLREVFVEYTAGLFFRWHYDRAPRALGLVAPLSGGCEFGVAWIAELQGRWVGRHHAEMLHVIPIANGDVIALSLRGNFGGPAPVEYLDHETGERVPLAHDFIDFLNRWTRLATIGPERWDLEPFLGPTGLDVANAPARKLQKYFRLNEVERAKS